MQKRKSLWQHLRDSVGGRQRRQHEKNRLLREGEIHYSAKRYDQALQAYKSAARLDNKSVQALHGKANSLIA